MALTDQIKKPKPTPLFVVVGAGDFVVSKIRATSLDMDFDPKQLRTLPEKAQAVAFEAIGQFSGTYAELAKRGEGLVSRVRRQAATRDLKGQASSTASQAKATTTTARKSAKSTTTRAKATSTSARKTASKAKKAAGDSARKVGN
ncbi:MAG: hypothetical protein ACRDP1_09955 [Nocardioidaceae bacterium]